jgi:hypothetical protein
MAVKTSWEDLARLGWPINEVFKRANDARGGSMKDKNDLALNEGIAAEYQYVSVIVLTTTLHLMPALAPGGGPTIQLLVSRTSSARDPPLHLARKRRGAMIILRTTDHTSPRGLRVGPIQALLL